MLLKGSDISLRPARSLCFSPLPRRCPQLMLVRLARDSLLASSSSLKTSARRLTWCRARRKTGSEKTRERETNERGGGSSWEQWKALADVDDSKNSADLSDVNEKLNEISNRAIKTMLEEKDMQIVDLMLELERVAEEWKARGEDEAGNYCLALLSLLNHEYDDSKLSLEYKAALKRVFFVIEDSGWKLVKKGSEHNDTELMDDELLQPPPSFSKY